MNIFRFLGKFTGTGKKLSKMDQCNQDAGKILLQAQECETEGNFKEARALYEKMGNIIDSSKQIQSSIVR